MMEINVNNYEPREIRRIIRHFEILFDMDYALPNSSIQETENGYVFSGKNKTIELNTKEAYELLLKFKNYE